MIRTLRTLLLFFFFFFNDTATTEIYTLSLHDALPIYSRNVHQVWPVPAEGVELDTVARIAARIRAGAVRLEKRGGVRRRIHGYPGAGPVRGDVAGGAEGGLPRPSRPDGSLQGLAGFVG